MYQKAYGIIETLAPLHVGASAGEETGNLNLVFRDQYADVEFLKYLIKFAYTMGGFGKSWRRVWHKKFFHQNPRYDKLIGCHWECQDSGWKNDISEWVNDIRTPKQLGDFLEKLENVCKKYFQIKEPQFLPWREAWHKKRVAVYSKIVSQSQVISNPVASEQLKNRKDVIELFHNKTYKQTQAIGGRKTISKNGREEEILVVSSVWHRLLPIGNNQYLEIITVFHGDRKQWQHKVHGDQLQPFIENLKGKELQLSLSWGQEPK